MVLGRDYGHGPVSCQAQLRVLVPVAETSVEGSYRWTRTLGRISCGCTLVVRVFILGSPLGPENQYTVMATLHLLVTPRPQ
eukprot:287727-Rhodomonas_salina.1